MSKYFPCVTVVMPINKDDGFFDLALKSVLNQTFTNFELIIVANNCSHQLWSRILEINDTRVIVKRLDMGGMAFALNTAVSLARTDYIARMDADDICLPSRLQSQFLFMERNPHVDILGGGIKLIDSKGELIGKRLNILETHAEVVAALPYRNPLVHPATFIRKKALLEIGGYKFGFTGEDYDLWIRMMIAGKVFHNLNEDVLLYRRHNSQMTANDKSYLIFSEISTMLFMYFLKTKNIRFLIGSFSQVPLIRKLKSFFLH